MDEGEARQKVLSLLNAEVTTFVDLTEEGELRRYLEILESGGEGLAG